MRERALVAALGGGAIAASLLAFVRASERRHVQLHDHPWTAELVAIAVGVLLVYGVWRLRRRYPEQQIGLLLLGAVTLAVAAIARPVYEQWIAEPTASYLTTLDHQRWLARVDTTGAVAFAAGLVFLGEHTERARNLAVPILGLAVLAHPAVTVSDAIARTFGDVPGTPGVWKAAAVVAVIQVAFAAACLALLDTLRE